MHFKKNKIIARALEVSTRAHNGHYRKGNNKIPYIVHPFEVALILQENNMSDQIIAAGLLHDTLEDTEMTIEYLKEELGEVIAEFVLGASEKLKNRSNTCWETRKEHTIKHLKKANIEIQCIICADKLSNIRSMIRNHDEIGDQLWNRFNRGYQKQKWYYTNLVKSLDDLEGMEMYKQFKIAVDYLF